jgi:hypothetical protein
MRKKFKNFKAQQQQQQQQQHNFITIIIVSGIKSGLLCSLPLSP